MIRKIVICISLLAVQTSIYPVSAVKDTLEYRQADLLYSYLTSVIDNFIAVDRELGLHFAEYQTAILVAFLEDGIYYLYNNFDTEGARQLQDNLVHGIMAVNQSYNNPDFEKRREEILASNEVMAEFLDSFAQNLGGFRNKLYEIRDMILNNQFQNNQEREEARARLLRLGKAFEIVIGRLRRNYLE